MKNIILLLFSIFILVKNYSGVSLLTNPLYVKLYQGDTCKNTEIIGYAKASVMSYGNFMKAQYDFMIENMPDSNIEMDLDFKLNGDCAGIEMKQTNTDTQEEYESKQSLKLECAKTDFWIQLWGQSSTCTGTPDIDYHVFEDLINPLLVQSGVPEFWLNQCLDTTAGFSAEMDCDPVWVGIEFADIAIYSHMMFDFSPIKEIPNACRRDLDNRLAEIFVRLDYCIDFTTLIELAGDPGQAIPEAADIGVAAKLTLGNDGLTIRTFTDALCTDEAHKLVLKQGQCNTDRNNGLERRQSNPLEDLFSMIPIPLEFAGLGEALDGGLDVTLLILLSSIGGSAVFVGICLCLCCVIVVVLVLAICGCRLLKAGGGGAGGKNVAMEKNDVDMDEGNMTNGEVVLQDVNEDQKF